MCFRCRGLSRKPVESEFEYEVYRGEVAGVTWSDWEAAELAGCQSRTKPSSEEGPPDHSPAP